MHAKNGCFCELSLSPVECKGIECEGGIETRDNVAYDSVKGGVETRDNLAYGSVTVPTSRKNGKFFCSYLNMKEVRCIMFGMVQI